MASGLRIAYARKILTDSLIDEYNRAHPNKRVSALPRANFKITDPNPVPQDSDAPSYAAPISELVPTTSYDSDVKKKYKVCIVGAGAAGLYTAMCLHKLSSLELEIDIIEASDEAGGRMFTHKFKDGHFTKHDYVDIGAMRIPDIPRMKTTFQLIEENLGLKDVLKEYTYTLDPKTQQPVEPSLWWFKNKSPESDKFETAMNALLAKFQFTQSFDVGFKNFTGANMDKYSTRNWLMETDPTIGPGFTYEETVEAEAAYTSTGLFDQALLETICDYTDFQAAKGVPWKRVEGGMKVIIDAMVDKVKEMPSTKITYNCPVVAFKNNVAEETLTVTSRPSAGGNRVTKDYDVIFNTTALPCLQRMDISELGLEKEVLTGIRTLAYDRATKVAIKFTRPWWRDYLRFPGGVSSSDLPISNTVYPSWEFEDGESAVLIASYAWAQDATRMGALFTNSKRTDEPDRDHPVVTLCLQNLATLWKATDISAPSYAELRDMYVDHFAWAWSHDPYQGGAYALFAPGQFEYIYPAFTKVHCQGKFAMCGEALSVEHAWISGALDSSYTIVQTWLGHHKHWDAQWELKQSPLGAGRGKHPLEFSEELVYWTAKLGCGVESHEGLGHTEKHDNVDVHVSEISPVA